MLTTRLRVSTTFTTRRVVRGIMTSTKNEEIKFGPFDVTKQVFLKTVNSFGVVNLKPLIPGHVLICPLRPHRRLTDLAPSEITDLFTAVQLTQKLMARAYFPSPGDVSQGSFTVAVQDGAEAGQTVPHLHVHIIPRQKGDMENPDDIYVEMASEKGNLGGALWDRGLGERPTAGGAMPRVEDADRKARTNDEMWDEAEKYKGLLKEMGVEWQCNA